MIIIQEVPSFLLRGLRKVDMALLFMCLDLLVPPLALLVLLLVGGLVVASIGYAIAGPYEAAVIFFGEVLLLSITMLSAWLRYGRDRFPFRLFLAAPAYLLWKIPIYFGLLFDRQTAWGGRTRRDDDV
jgi:hypothetical protein